jgi:hypothetical protein
MALTYVDQELQNWNEQIRVRPQSIAVAENLEDIVWAVRNAEQAGSELKACGARLSFTAAPFTDQTMLLTNKLNRIIFIQKGAMPIEGDDIPLKGDILRSGRSFAHVECGVTIKRLADRLMIPHINLAIPTAGGGSTEQFIAGFISTGSHGGDFSRGSFVEWVRAIHLVGTDGRQYWIERSEPNDITTDDKLRGLSYWSPNTKIIRDDDIFFATLVSCGRMGVIYSLIIEVVDAYYLKEARVITLWQVVRDSLLGRPKAQLFEAMKESMEFTRPLHFLSLTATLDPLHPFCYAQGRQITTNTSSTPKYDLKHDIMDDLLFHHSDWIGILDTPGRIGYKLNGLGDDNIRALQNFLYGKAFQPYKFQGPWWHVMFSEDIGLRVLSAEYAFDATTPHYLRFINEIRARAKNPLIPGLLTLRFLPRSSALLSMQRFDETVHIEISTPIGYRAAPSFFDDIDRIARNSGAIPHWGQLHSLNRAETKSLYGERLADWKSALSYLSVGGTRTFSNEFTRARGLEPVSRDSLLLLAGC